MAEPFEYAIKKDVRNNPIVREVDEARQRELWKSVGVAAFLVVVLLFSAWQHFELLRHGYRLEQMQRERAAEEEAARQLRLEIETLRSPKRIEELATGELHLVAPTRDEAIVIERVVPAEPPANRWWHGGDDRLRRCRTRHRRQPRRPSGDWRVTLKRRAHRRRQPARPVGGRASKRGSVYLQVVDRADLVARAERQQKRTPARRRPSAATSSIAAAACWRPASTPTRSTRCRPRSTTKRGAVEAAVRCARRLHGARTPGSARAAQQPAQLRLRAAPGRRRTRRGASRRSISTASASSRRAAATIRTTSSRRTCSASSASTTRGSAASSRPTTRRFAARTARFWSTTDARAARLQPRRAAADRRLDRSS